MILDRFRLPGKVAIVTGASAGIGRGSALALAEAGADVVLAARTPEKLEQVAERIRGMGRKALAVPCDVRETAELDAVVARAIAELGRIDILVNNAAGNFICRAEDLTPNGWNAVIGIVLNGSFYCSRAAGRHMIERGAGGSIVSILANYTSSGSAGTIHSASAKAGVLAMTRTLAIEWARHRIRVNAVSPGPIESPGAARQLWSSPEAVERITGTVPLGRWGTPDEIANAVLFLVSPHAAYVTGEVLTVDGGQSLGRSSFGFLDLPGSSRPADGTSRGR